MRRWLDRLTRAVESSMWESAAAESQCLEAEVRSLREHLWGLAAGVVPRRSPLRPFGLGMALGLSLILATGDPVSLSDMGPWGRGFRTSLGSSEKLAARPLGDQPREAVRREVQVVPPPVVPLRPAEAVGADRSRGEGVPHKGKSLAVDPGGKASGPGKRSSDVKVPAASGVGGSTVSLEEAIMLLRAGQRALEGQ